MPHLVSALLAASLAVAGASGGSITTATTSPGVVFRLGTEGLNKVAAAFLPEVVAAAKATSIPGGGDGKHYSYDGFSFSGFGVGSATVSTDGTGTAGQLKLSLTDITLSTPHVHFSVWDKILGIKISCGGSFWASMSGTSIVTTLAVKKGSDAGGVPLVPSSSAVDFGSLSVDHHLDNTACRVGEDIVEVFIGNINGKIKDAVQKSVPDAINKELQSELAKALSTLTGSVAIDKYASIQYGVVADGAVGAAGVSYALPLSGAFTAAGANGTAPAGMPPAAPLSDDSSLKRDVSVQVSDYVANTASRVYYDAGAMQTSTDVDAKYNTSLFTVLVPKLAQLCQHDPVAASGAGCPFYISLSATEAPAGVFHDGAATVAVQGAVLNVSVVQPAANGTHAHTPAFDVRVSGSLNATAGVSSDFKYLTTSLSLAYFNFSLVQSHIGQFDLAAVSDLVQFVLKDVAIPIFDKEFKGVPLPTLGDGVQLIAPTLAHLEHELRVLADVNITVAMPSTMAASTRARV